MEFDRHLLLGGFPGAATVPDVLSLTQAGPAAEIRAAGLTVGGISHVNNCTDAEAWRQQQREMAAGRSRDYAGNAARARAMLTAALASRRPLPVAGAPG